MTDIPRTSSQWRSTHFSRESKSPSPGPQPRPISMFISSPVSNVQSPGHVKSQSYSPTNLVTSVIRSDSLRGRSSSFRNSSYSSTGTFAPQFIKDQELKRAPSRVTHLEGENDLSGKRYVWLHDDECTFVQGWVVKDDGDGSLVVQLDDGSQRHVEVSDVDKVNPAKFDKANDMAELTHLNEPSVVHNLRLRYNSDLIYTYSGLFLVAVNPYCPLPIYSRDYINMYRGIKREDTKPHIFAVADEAFRNLVEEGRNQSILVTGESGAGKTENTKKVIQYLAAVANTETTRSSNKALSNLSQQILQANPILESFGNAQTLRNNNSSRFGKFIRIQVTRTGQIAGAYIDWYLLEKSRVVRLNHSERNYHIFYQLLRGADSKLKRQLLLEGKDIDDFEYTRHGNDSITGVSDSEEWNVLVDAFKIMGISNDELEAILRTVSAVLQLGNVDVIKESLRADQANLDATGHRQAQMVCQLLGIPTEPFVNALLHPRVKAGREWVDKVQTPEQVRLSIHALAKGIYERGFGDLVDRINQHLNHASISSDETHYIGVLDIAGFEIFEENSFEQLCINYTNEKLQQFFNHHMFVLEQEEYAREQIEWKFIDFGRDLQPTIDLIELANPIGIFSCLDEESVMPKATDKTFTEKLHSLWDQKTPKYRRSLLQQGFMLTHYAAEVEYSTDGWLDKNKDPLNDSVTRLLALSADKHVATLFADCADPDDDAAPGRTRVKKGLFRTVAQRHKEQLSTLMVQLHSTHPHFVRCILPNHKKKPKAFNAGLVLDQLRCNGVLEGIRIARTGFPNRLPFAEFRARYEVLCKTMPRGYIEGREAAEIILDTLGLDTSLFRVGVSKVFFRAGVLAELEEQRDDLIRDIFSRFQSLARGYTQRRTANKRLYRAEAARIIQKNIQVYCNLQENPWWRLFVKMRPMLGNSRQSGELKKRDEIIQKLREKMVQDAADHQKIEEERRRAEFETAKVQQTLESERALALDKDEIFKRLQDRETELSDKLSGALEDQESLEEQIDGLILAKQKAETKSTILRTELEQAGILMKTLEEEKQAALSNLSDANSRLSDLENSHSMASHVEESLTTKIGALTGEIGLKDQMIHNLEQKMLDGQAELDKFHLSNEECKSSLQNEIRVLRNNIEAKIHEVRSLETTISTNQRELEERNLRVVDAEELLRKEVKMLGSQLNMKDRKIQELENQNSKDSRDSDAKLSLMTKDLQNLKEQNKNVLADKESLKIRLSSLTSSSTRYEDSIRSIERELQLSKEKTLQVQSENESFRSELEQKKNHLHKMEGKLHDQDNELQTLRKQVERLKEEKSSAQEQLGKVSSRSSEYEIALRSKEDELAVLKNEKENVELDRRNFDEESRKLSLKHISYQAGLRGVHSELEAVKMQFCNDMAKSRDKIEQLVATIGSLHTIGSVNEADSQRKDDQLREERERGQRLERELEGWKALRMDRGEIRRSGSYKPLSDIGSANSRQSRRQSSIGSQGEISQRSVSLTKGFL